MVTTPPHKLLEPGTNFTTDPKRKEPAEPMVCPEEYKRRRFPPSGMAKRISGSFLQKFDGDDGKGVGKGEGKGKKWMMSDFFRPQAEAEDDKRNKQDMLLNIEKAKSDPRLEQVRNARYIAFWQAEVKKTNEELRKKDVVHQLDQAEVRKMKEELRKKDSVHQLDQAEVEKMKEELRKKDAAHQIDEAELKTAIDDLLKNCAAHQLDQATTESRLQMETNRLEHAWTELRVLENEAAAKRRRDIPLPPAYGNLDDEDRFPPCSVHEDGGALEVAHLKRETRRNFDKILTRALNSRLEKTCKLELLLALAGGLSTACDSLQKLLDIAPQVPVSRIRKPLDFGSYIDLQLRSLIDSLRDSKRGDASISGDFDSIKCKHPRIIERILERPSHTYLPGYAIIQKDGSAPYVADRIAKLLLELLWCCVAACEVRPGPGTLTPSTARTDALMASIMLIFVKVDSVLVQALQLAFSRGITTSKLQYHLTQLDRLNAIFEAELYEQVASRHFFAKAIAWLNEQVEKIRSMSEIETFKLAHPEIFGDGDGDDDDDDVSSRWQGSDNSAEEAVDVEEGEYEHWSRVTTRTSTGMEN